MSYFNHSHKSPDLVWFWTSNWLKDYTNLRTLRLVNVSWWWQHYIAFILVNKRKNLIWNSKHNWINGGYLTASCNIKKSRVELSWPKPSQGEAVWSNTTVLCCPSIVKSHHRWQKTSSDVYRASLLSMIFGIWKKLYTAKFVLLVA